MSNRLHEERVDIYQLPWVKKRELGENQITIGDLHGNAIKLMFTLVSEGIVTNMTSEDYQALVRIYLSPIQFDSPTLLLSFNKILS